MGLKWLNISVWGCVSEEIQPVNKTTITLRDVSEHESCINSACPVGLE